MRLLFILALVHRQQQRGLSGVSAWSWSPSNNNDIASTGPQVSGHTCVASPIKSSGGSNENAKIFLFGGQLPLPSSEDSSAERTLDISGGAGAAVTSSSGRFGPPSKFQTPAEARAESERLAAAASAGRRSNDDDPPPAAAAATHDLWVYEKDKEDPSLPDWTLVPRKDQGISRPSARSHAAAAVLGHMMFLFGGYDPAAGKELGDVWTLSMKSHKWSLCQAWMPYEISNHVACAISKTKVGIFTRRGDVLVYDDDLPTPSVLERATTGEGPGELRSCACCGIPRTAADDADNAENERDMLIFGGSTGETSGFSSDAFRLDTTSWEWTKLVPKSPNNEFPPALRSASVASIGKNRCVVFGGAASNERVGAIRPSDETWLLTVDGDDANWERIAVDGPVNPEARLAASLIATTPEELVLQGGYDPTNERTFGSTPGTAGGGATWILTKRPIDHSKIAKEKAARQRKMRDAQLTEAEAAASRVSDIIAGAGSGMGFDGASLGVGGLDHVLEEVKRRIWTPLAAPPKLLKELGIQPTRGLLLYGGPGCGKTLLASRLGNMLSPFRPITVVNGPEILDKFVGSSEENLRRIFDDPPDIYDEFKRNETDGGVALGHAAVHVVVMDEFDAVARSRGGGGAGAGGQGDAGVARDSVVNQLLSKMDGVQPLKVPTLVIGLTNKKDLIDPALLRPGRFEVQIEIEPPKTFHQRRSIVLVHTKQMFDAGRLEVNDPPPGSAAANRLEASDRNGRILSYDQLADRLANHCRGFSGAAIAGVTRAAASRALARSVGRLSGDSEYSSDDDDEDDAPSGIMDCLVTQDDFYQAINDVRGRSGNADRAAKEEGVNGGVNGGDGNRSDRAAKEEGVRGAVNGGVNGSDCKRGFRARLRRRIRTWKRSGP